MQPATPARDRRQSCPTHPQPGPVPVHRQQRPGQIAQALLQQAGGDDFVMASAGTEPKGVNPYTVRVLTESGIDWSQARGKSVTEFVDQPWDYVNAVCDRARQACPVFPGPHDQLQGPGRLTRANAGGMRPQHWRGPGELAQPASAALGLARLDGPPTAGCRPPGS